MSNLKLPNKILRLKGMKVTGFTFQDHDRELHLTVKPHKKRLSLLRIQPTRTHRLESRHGPQMGQNRCG